jgi:3-hydroxyisobutyrate dehydrogenase-like beta-hydroxyacid dehydrogenase
MAGGTPEDFAVAKPLLETMGKKILHVGPMGHGSVLKLATNLVAACIVSAMNEGLVLATKAGLDPAMVSEVLAERSPLIGRTAPRILAGQFAANFPLRLSHKDTQLALATGRNLGVPMFTTGTVAQLQTAALGKGMGDLDQTATIQVLEEIAGVKVRKRNA